MQALLQHLVKICRFSKPADDSGQFPVQQVEYMDKVGTAFTMMPYGLHANIPENYLGIIFQIGAQENNRIAFPLSSKERIRDLKPGEIVLYHPEKKTFIHLKENGDIDVDTQSNVNIKSPIINLDGDVTITGKCDIGGDAAVTGALTQNNIDVGSLHNHNQGNDSGGNVEQPTLGVNP